MAVANPVFEGSTFWLVVATSECVGTVGVAVCASDSDFVGEHVFEALAGTEAWETLLESVGVALGSFDNVNDGLSDSEKDDSKDNVRLSEPEMLRVRILPLNSCDGEDVGVGVLTIVAVPVFSGDSDSDVVPLMLSDGEEEFECDSERSSV